MERWESVRAVWATVAHNMHRVLTFGEKWRGRRSAPRPWAAETRLRMRSSSPHLSHADGITGIHTDAPTPQLMSHSIKGTLNMGLTTNYLIPDIRFTLKKKKYRAQIDSRGKQTFCWLKKIKLTFVRKISSVFKMVWLCRLSLSLSESVTEWLRCKSIDCYPLLGEPQNYNSFTRCPNTRRKHMIYNIIFIMPKHFKKDVFFFL